MSEKFQQPNAYRQSVERDELRISEAKNRLVNKVESELARKFIQVYQNAKLTGLSEADLTAVEGPTSSAEMFDGTITVKAEIMTDNKIKQVSVPIKISQSSYELDEDNLRQLVDATEADDLVQRFNVEDIDATALEVDLGGFELKDQEDEYFHIYHPALDIGRELARVTKQEYETITNKESLYRSVIENQLIGSKFDGQNFLNFTGSFVEPKVTVIARSKSTYKKASFEEIDEPEEDRLMATIGNSYQQSIERNERAANDQKSRLLDRLVSEVTNQLSFLQYGNVKVSSVTDDLEFSGSDFSGKVEINADLFDADGPKAVVIPLVIEMGAYKLLKPDVIKDIVASGIDPRDAIDATVEKEVQDKVALVDEHTEFAEKETEAALDDEKPEMKKTAGDSGAGAYVGQTDVLRLPKHLLGLPEDVEIGTVIYADGFHWKLTSKSESQLSKGEDEGSIYVFNKVPAQDKEPEHKLDR